ncbi:S-adenosyl-L-methionine-dependent methyltransferase [Clavulina sp. PMI_390]|nr:S-adenosyl-L-methionine-dependent methyltransferase [Clavulina sp. PMI_390]
MESGNTALPSSIRPVLSRSVEYYFGALPRVYPKTSSIIASFSSTQRSICTHYSICNENFARFFGEDRVYSGAVWTPREIKTYEDKYSADRLGIRDTAAFGEVASNQANALAILSQADNELSGDLEREPWSAISSPTDIEPPAYIERGLQDPLHEARTRKLRLIIQKADIQRRHRVLEIGTGLGSFAIFAVQTIGCKVDTLTQSYKQAIFARERIRAAGLEESITVHLMDYRLAPLQHDPPLLPFSPIEMGEHVGKEFLPAFFQVADECLKPEGTDSVGVAQLMTMPQARMPAHINDTDFIQKWSKFFPKGVLTPLAQLISALQSGTGGAIIIDSIVNVGIHHGPTLRMWRESFEHHFDVAGGIRDALVRQDPELDGTQIEVIRRRWLYY